MGKRIEYEVTIPWDDGEETEVVRCNSAIAARRKIGEAVSDFALPLIGLKEIVTEIVSERDIDVADFLGAEPKEEV